MTMNVTLFLILSLVPCVLADGWEDFTNNLATDLAPLITLFGERLTKQFLSESTSLVDNFIFALSPLGVLTAVVSVIRICGSSSLRAFVGRAQEGPAEAEGELLPCVSESTAELFNDGGISRVFGRPRIVEIVAWENEDKNTGEKSIEIGTLRDALATGAWSCKGSGVDLVDIKDPNYMPEMDIPNLSLNKGIKQKDTFWFYAAAVLGAILQIGALLYAALTVFVFPKSFTVNGGPVDSYAFPFYLTGTTLLFMGMFYCAVIIERSSKEHYFKPAKPSKLYWLQPGDQDVGDQVFNLFLAVKEGSDGSMTKKLRYIKSRRVMKYDKRYVEVYTTLLMTLLGFIFQFIGERGLHSSVILAQLGSTFAMSVLRTILRTERMSQEENMLRDERELVARKQQELDSFAFYLEQVQSFNLITSLPDNVPPNEISDKSLAKHVIKTRARLADLTKGENSRGWDSLPIRKVAQNLAKTIETTMDLMSSWGFKFDKEFEFPLYFECKSSSSTSASTIFGAHSIRLRRLGDALRWRVVDADGLATTSELEAIIGLWTWSLCKSDDEWHKPFSRMVGLSEPEAESPGAYLYFHKWIFRQTEATLVTRKMVDIPRRLFGHDSKTYPNERDILVMKTSSELEVMAAQDVYIRFLAAIFSKVEELGGEVHMVAGLQNTWIAQHTRVDDLAHCFEDKKLGSREDALLCIVPSLKRAEILPRLTGDCSNVRKQIEKMIQGDDWDSAFSLLIWICQRSEGDEFELSMLSIGYLCRRAMFHNSKTIREEGIKHARTLLQADLRIPFFQDRNYLDFSNWVMETYQADLWNKVVLEFGWMCWHISASSPGMQSMQRILATLSISGELEPDPSSTLNEQETELGLRMMKAHLTVKVPNYSDELLEHDFVHLCELALGTGKEELTYWMMVRLVELGKENSEYLVNAWTLAGKTSVEGIPEILQFHEADIDSTNEEGRSALINHIINPDLEAIKKLLEYGASPDGIEEASRMRPLLIAAVQGRNDILELLLRCGANVEVADHQMGLSALHHACSSDNLEATRMLLAYGADVHTSGPQRMTPLHFAIRNKNLEMINLLLEHGANIHDQDGRGDTAFMTAVRVESVDVMRLLVKWGAVITTRNFSNLDALDTARIDGFTEGIQMLEALLGLAADAN
ncbi:uncharacterized protein N7483_007205 [Penicillium malachiteum]|uniref:uncharacterized protein n=1 Tax=Penicillium malachiteum TaxID=1324776 RepID=UPI0025483248|nr:uncharacterized protein N7483_007205 [Penicillium malachiteum]KAJ5725848.1 hypothetical protein N7483_007205 [Penicillium malachiteum]